jgi:hypothetical protein
MTSEPITVALTIRIPGGCDCAPHALVPARKTSEGERSERACHWRSLRPATRPPFEGRQAST